MRDFTARNLLAQTSSPMLAPSGESLSLFLDMEIKVGDKVRVSKATPNMYLVGFGYAVIGDDSKVREIDECNALIKWRDNFITIPCKYLIKVEDEAKEPEFKVGDRVIVTNADNSEYKGLVSMVEGIANRNAIILNCNGYLIPFRESDLAPYTEPKEEKKLTDLTKEVANNMSNVLEGCCNAINNIANNFDWDSYTADLAKEIAVKLSKPNENKPGYVADYAVSVAKAVVENLKKK